MKSPKKKKKKETSPIKKSKKKLKIDEPETADFYQETVETPQEDKYKNSFIRNLNENMSPEEKEQKKNREF